MEDAVRYFLTGISYGMILFLIACGLSLILGVMGILNMSHGSLYMLGAYVGLTLANQVGNFLLVALVSGLAIGVFGLVLERVFLSRLYKQFNEQVLLTLGFVYILSNVALWVWGSFPFFGKPPEILDFSIPIGRLGFPVYRLALLGGGLVIAACLWWFQEKTRAGAIVRAGMDDKQMTMGLGINYALVCSAIFFLGAFLAGFAGYIGSSLTGASWDMGFTTLVLATIVVIVGGIGRVEGTLLGALVIGLIDSLGKTFFPDFALFTIFVVFIIILLVRPSGLLGRLQIVGAPPPSIATNLLRKGIPKEYASPWLGRLMGWGPYFVFGAILLILPLFAGPYVRTWMVQVLIFGIFAASLNLLFGYTGLFSMGHAAYLGVGAYTTAILSVKLGVDSFWVVAPSSIVMAGLFAGLFGLFALRVSGPYFLFLTVAVGELLSSVALRWVSLTGGSNGIFGVPYPTIAPQTPMDAASFYYLVLAVFAVSMYVMYRLVKSPFGLAMQGVRDDEHRMRHLGYNTALYKYVTFVIGGAFAGLAGALFAPFSGTVVPPFLGTVTAASAMLMIIIGSPRTFFGPVLGAGIILALQYFASVVSPERWPLILGGTFILAVLFLPGGIGVHIARLWNKLRYLPPESMAKENGKAAGLSAAKLDRV